MLNDFRKICPVCLGISISKTKKYCDFCKCVLVDVEGWDLESGYNGKDSFVFRLVKNGRGV